MMNKNKSEECRAVVASNSQQHQQRQSLFPQPRIAAMATQAADLRQKQDKSFFIAVEAV